MNVQLLTIIVLRLFIMEEEMIVKELDGYEGDDKLIKAGHEAEKQMSHYLLRKYHNDKNIFVINTLRFPWLDGYAQIDHLILHRYGAIIIESKSVSSKVRYNEHEEWNRLWNNHWDKMENPIKQAERQGKALHDLLCDHTDQLRGKLLGLMQMGFKYMAIDCIVAISDQCIGIQRPTNDPYKDTVVKADLVTDQVDGIIAAYKKKDSIFFKGEPPWTVGHNELEKIYEFLLNRHELFYKQSVSISEESPEEVPIDPPVTDNLSEKISALSCCEECGGNVSILWGSKYKNYYWHCNSCGKNFPINFKCPNCQEKLRIRKRKNEYYIYCDPCSLEALYHTQVE